MNFRASEQDRSSPLRSRRRESLVPRSTGWAVTAAAALAALATVAQTPSGTERLQHALAAVGAEAGARAASAKPTGPDEKIKALQAQIERLTGERERLEGRLAALEHGLEDVTGSIRRQAGQPSGPAEPPGKTAAVPVIDPLGTPPAGPLPQMPKAAETAPPPAPTPAEPPAAQAEAPQTAPAPAAPDTHPAAPKAEADAPPSKPAAAAVALPSPAPPPQSRVAALSAPAARPAPVRHEYGIELASAPNLDALRARWAGVKANFGPLLVGLNPLAMKDPRHGSTGLKLIAGPLPNLAAARELCARFAAANGACWPMRVDASAVLQP
jgi:TolA-binding protein